MEYIFFYQSSIFHYYCVDKHSGMSFEKHEDISIAHKEFYIGIIL